MKLAHSIISRTLSFCAPKKTKDSSRATHQPDLKKGSDPDSYTGPSANLENDDANSRGQVPLNDSQNGVKSALDCSGVPEAKCYPYASIPAVQLSHDETLDEVFPIAQAVIKRQLPVQQALSSLDGALRYYPDSKELLLARALLNFDAQNTKACIADCKAVLVSNPNNIIARCYETAALHKSKVVFGKSLMQDVQDTLESHRYVRSRRPMRLAVIVSHAVYVGSRVRDDENKIEEVKSLYNLDPTDRCVCALLAVKHYDRWYWKAEANHAAQARSVAQHMLNLWPHDRIATSIIHHLDGHLDRECSHVVDFQSRNPFYGTTVYPNPFLDVETVLDYPLSVLDPSTKVNLWEYVTQST